MNLGKEEYHELVEQFRHHYKKSYGIDLENDIIYLFIRINEMHLDLKKDIRSQEIQKPKDFWERIRYYCRGKKASC